MPTGVPKKKIEIFGLSKTDTRRGRIIKEVIEEIIPEFNVALAHNYEPELTLFECETWYASRKLDGVRCLAVVNEEGECTLYSRMGKEFTTLNKVKEGSFSTFLGTKSTSVSSLPLVLRWLLTFLYLISFYAI